MARPEKTVFISYRRNDVSWALAVYENLTNNGFDVFFDYESIESGDFEQIILANIKARAHFLIILTPTALDRCNEPGDWLRREIEIAISERRNIVPLLFNDFDFAAPSVAEKLTGELGKLKRYNGLEVPAGYFSEAMERLREKYLDITLDSVLHPIPVEVQKEVKKQQEAADQAILRGESSLSEITEAGKKWIQNFNFTHLVMGGVILLAVSTIFLAIYYFTNNPLAALMPTATSAPSVTPFVSPTIGSTDAPPDTPVIPASPAPVPVVGSVLISDVDGMEMVYVPAGEFQMGSETGEPDERPVHTVSLDAYWIDRTEVTNAMYTRCVEDGTCHPPSSSSSSTRDLYFGNPEFENYPVLYVSWEAANAYCAWAGRRLPAESEWEKAAGWDEENRTQRIYPWGNTAFDGTRANFCDRNCQQAQKNPEYDDGYADTAPVGSYPAGASFYGALDMAGNVWEWVADFYDAYPGGDANASENFGQTYLVVRGSSWFFPGQVLRAANRAPNQPDEANSAIGFRCALSASE
jgi:formylglycine-generating enzyme required for sulfatase activity